MQAYKLKKIDCAFDENYVTRFFILNMKYNRVSLELTEPVLVLGIGGAGCRLASSAKRLFDDSDCVLISADQKDLVHEKSIKIETNGIINPSSRAIRGFSLKVMDDIRYEVSRHGSVIILANLAGRTGTAVTPLVTRICNEEGKNPVSLAIMPFKFENNRIFDAGVSLKRIRSDSACTIIIDNDAMVKSNPNMTIKECHRITNGAALHMINSLQAGKVHGGTQVLSASKQRRDVEISIRDALKMLYENVQPDKVSESMIYVVGSDVPVGMLDAVTKITRCKVGSPSADVIRTDSHNIVMLSSVMGNTKFDEYDALGDIPAEDIIDWNLPDCDYDCHSTYNIHPDKTAIYQMED